MRRLEVDLATLLLCAVAGCGDHATTEAGPGAPPPPAGPPVAQAPGGLPETPPPPFSEGVFPCTDCHDPELPVNARRRVLKLAHQEIALHHNEEERWCLDCHAAADRDQLHLANGEAVPFEESYRLCGQCHGDKYRDWRAGVHGRRAGEWNGHKTYLLCVHCHDAHAPRFKPLAPEPAPAPPRRTP